MITSSHASPRHRHPQERYKSIPGVVNTVVGYTGGTTANPTYNTVCRNDGHTEAIKVEFDPGVISYEELMRTFFSEAGGGGGKTQYQSAVWPQTDEQKAVAQRLADERHSTVRPLPTLTPTPTPTPTPNPDPSPNPNPNPNPEPSPNPNLDPRQVALTCLLPMLFTNDFRRPRQSLLLFTFMLSLSVTARARGLGFEG